MPGRLSDSSSLGSDAAPVNGPRAQHPSLMNLNQINVQAFIRDVHVGWAAVGIRDVARESHELPVATNGGVRLCPITLRAARTRMCQPVNRAAINARKNDLVFVELPIT